MPENLIGELRRSAVVMTYAPGAVMDMRADGGPVSVVSAGLEEWDSSAPLRDNLKYQKIIERRLCKKLGKKYFRLPPVLEDGAKIPGTDMADPSALVGRRFPSWLQCPECDLLKPVSKWQAEPGRAYRYCASCTSKKPGRTKVFAVPVRFAVACENGHLDDFPFSFWVKHKESCRSKLEYQLSSTGAGLSGLILRCVSCGERRSMEGAFRKAALAGLTCQGSRPWLRTDDRECNCTGNEGTFRVVQRGASNLYYPVMDSALDIPPWTRNLERVLGDWWDTLEGVDSHEARVHFIQHSQPLREILASLDMTAHQLSERFSKMLEALDSSDLSELRADEYRVLCADSPEKDPEFEIYPEQIPDSLKPVLQRVIRVARLREVRVVRGFTRIRSATDDGESGFAPLATRDLDWLPGIEVRGEGIFLQIREDSLAEWERRPAVIARCSKPALSWRAEWRQRCPDRELPYEVTPRLLLVHGLAHALIKQLTLECGYSSASLRERLYVSDEMAGVLIYTSTPDSDGTLGGLQRRASSDLLETTLVGAIESLRWCSSDPLCITGELAVPEAHSIASCHACSMVPETSCELHNRFLDRALIVGTDESPHLGFFRALCGD